MGMLDRYRKSGGFVQLLQLLETCGEAKQKKLLEMIEAEDARWSSALKKKILSIDVIFGWPQEQLAEIVGQLQELTLAFTLKGLSPELQEKAQVTLSHGQKRRLNDLVEGRSVSQGEINTAFAKVIEEVRDQINNGYLRPKEFDPERAIEEDIEEKLALAPLFPVGDGEDEPAVAGEDLVFDLPGESSGGDSSGLQKQVNRLKNEVAQLKRENSRLKVQATDSKDTINKIKKLLAS